MLGKSPKKRRRRRRKKPAGGGYPNQDFPGIIPALDDLADRLPDDLKPHGKRIVGILIIAVIAIFAIFLIEILVASFTGHSDLMMTLFAPEIIVAGIVTVAAIVLTTKKSVK
jgi:hypothetical protein